MKEALQKFWEGWKKFGRFMGDLIAHVVLTLLYFTIFLPVGVLMRLLADRLDIKEDKKSVWVDRQTNDLALDDARRLF